MENNKITRKNYEAFLLDAVEGNLSEENKQLLDVFLSENHDLIPETDGYDPDISITKFPDDVFPDKKRLLFATRHKNIIIKYISAAAVLLLLIAIPLIVNLNRSTKEPQQYPTNIKPPVIAAENRHIQTIQQDVNIKTSKDKNMTAEEKIIFDTLTLIRINNSNETEKDIYITQNQSFEIIIDGGDKSENANMITTNKILTYETNY